MIDASPQTRASGKSMRQLAEAPTPVESSRSSRKSLQVVVGELRVVGDVREILEDALPRSIDDA